MRRLLVSILALGLLAPASAEAHVSPMGCSANLLNLTMVRNRQMVRPGETVIFGVNVSNVGANGCDATGVTTKFTPPGGTETTIGTRDFAFGEFAEVAAPEWTAPMDQPVGIATAAATITGTIHNGAHDTATVGKTLGVEVIKPKLGMTLTPEPATGPAPLSVTYRYRLSNLSEPAAGLRDPVITHPDCSPVVPTSGNPDGDTTIDPGEEWVLTCTRVFNTPGTHTASAIASATSLLDFGDVDASVAPTTVTVGASSAHLSLSKSASPVSGIAPLNVTYAYTVLNDGPSIPISDIAVEDAACGPVTTTAGMAPLAPGASRVFTCAATFGVGTFSSSAIATGTDTVTGLRVNSAAATAGVDVARAPEPEVTPVVVPDTPAQPPSPKPSTNVSFSYTGRFTPARSCTGTVTLTLKAGTKRLATKRVKLDSRCRYRVSFTVARTRLGKATRVTVTAKAGKRTASRRLNVPKA